MVPAHAQHAALCEQSQGFVGEQAVVDEIAATDDLVARGAVHPLQCVLERVHVRMDVGDDSNPVHGECSLSCVLHVGEPSGHHNLADVVTVGVRHEGRDPQCLDGL